MSPGIVLTLAIVVVSAGVGSWMIARSRRRADGAPPVSHERQGPLPLAHGTADALPDASAADDPQHLGGLYRSVFQSVADALVVIDERGKIRSFSPSAERTFGYEADEVIGQNVSILMTKPDGEHHSDYVRQYVESGWASGRMETLVLTGDAHIIRPAREIVAARKDGSPFPARLIVSEVETGGSRLFVGLVSDVSERKRLENELEAQVESQTVLLHQLQEAYSVIEGQKKRMQFELDVGREIQLSMVPHDFPRLPEVDLWATLRPAREVGGDFYDFFTTGTGQLWMCVGDVSGKGVPAALLMAVTKTLIKALAARGGSPAEVMTLANAELSRENDRSMFVTAFLARLDPASGEMCYVNAGHNPPLVRRAGSGVDRLATRHGPVLGALETVRYSESVDQLGRDDVLLLYTDGVTEAMDPDEQLFSESRLHQTLVNGGHLPVEELTDAVVSDVEEFAGEAEQADDITVLVLRYLGARRPELEVRFAFQVAGRVDALASMQDKVERLVERCGGTESMKRQFAVAFDELVSNILKYGGPSQPERVIDCELQRQDGAIVAVIVDDGAPFNPLDLPAPDTTLPLEEREMGGLGVHIVRQMFDEVSYERRASSNVITISQRDRSL